MHFCGGVDLSVASHALLARAMGRSYCSVVGYMAVQSTHPPQMRSEARM